MNSAFVSLRDVLDTNIELDYDTQTITLYQPNSDGTVSTVVLNLEGWTLLSGIVQNARDADGYIQKPLLVQEN